MPILLTALILAQAAMPMAHAGAARDVPEPVCVRAGDLPPAFAQWNAAPSTMLRIGKPIELTAEPAGRVKWAVRPGKPGDGAVRRFDITHAGIYRLGLSNGAWVDIVSRGKALQSVAHDHGPLCTGLRKIVDFRLARGRYTLQLAAMPAPATRVMLVAK